MPEMVPYHPRQFDAQEITQLEFEALSAEEQDIFNEREASLSAEQRAENKAIETSRLEMERIPRLNNAELRPYDMIYLVKRTKEPLNGQDELPTNWPGGVPKPPKSW